MKRVQVTYVGPEEEYGTTDPGDEIAPGLFRMVTLKQGESAFVSEEKAAQMLADFPGLFEFGSAEEMELPEAVEAPPEPPAESVRVAVSESVEAVDVIETVVDPGPAGEVTTRRRPRKGAGNAA